MQYINSTLKALILLALFLTTAVHGRADDSKVAFENEKAILISKFIRHITWPDKINGDKFTIGIYGERQFYNFMSDFYKDKTVKGKDVIVTFIDSSSAAKEVDLVYFPASQQKRVFRAAKQVKGYHVLVVGEYRKAMPDTMINLITDENALTVEVEIDYSAIKKENLVIPSSRSFLNTVNDDELFTLRQSAIEKNKINAQLIALQQQVTKQKGQLLTATKSLEQAQKSSSELELTSQQQLEEITQLQQSITENNLTIKALQSKPQAPKSSSLAKLQKKNKALESKNKKLQTAAKKLEVTNRQLVASNKQLKAKNEKLLTTIAASRTTSTAEPKQLAVQESEVQPVPISSQQLQELQVIKDENEQLAVFSSLFYALLLIMFAAFGAIAFLGLRYKKSVEAKLTIRQQQLLKSENVTTFGYLATDTTYSAAESLEQLCEDTKDARNIAALKPTITLLNNLNTIVADQDESDKKRFDIAEYFSKVTTLFSDEFQQSDINYRYEGPRELVITSIPSQVALVLINLINNSIKHGFNNKGNGKISLSMKKTASGGVTIVYNDDGKGMDEATQKQVFTPFFTTKSDRGYVGLGMSNTRDLIQNSLKGSISLESSVGKGIKVTITI